MSGHIHITPLGGIAGDMFVAGMLDAFPEFKQQILQTTGLILPDCNAFFEEVFKGGIRAQYFKVPKQSAKTPVYYTDMDSILQKVELPAQAQFTSRTMLKLLAEAEAEIHGIPLVKVHFHEIADWDTLADLTAAALIISILDGWSWSVEPVPLGAGIIETQHGRLCVPAPASALLLQGLPVHDDGISGERVTPTGAVIIHYIMNYLKIRSRPMGRLRATGYGAGKADLAGLANVTVVQIIDGKVQDRDSVNILEWDIDDMTGEEIAVAAEHLRLCEGVLDLVTIALSGKKARPFTGFRTLVKPAFTDSVVQAVFSQTSTLGVRVREEQRFILPRSLNNDGKIAIRPKETTKKSESDNFASLPSLAKRRAAAREAEE
jgi:uncharacterized protein (TIGR00299 family) protein